MHLKAWGRCLWLYAILHRSAFFKLSRAAQLHHGGSALHVNGPSPGVLWLDQKRSSNTSAPPSLALSGSLQEGLCPMAAPPTQESTENTKQCTEFTSLWPHATIRGKGHHRESHKAHYLTFLTLFIQKPGDINRTSSSLVHNSFFSIFLPSLKELFTQQMHIC